MSPEQDRAILLARLLAVIDHGRSVLGLQKMFNWGAHLFKPANSFKSFLGDFLKHNVPDLRKVDDKLTDRLMDEVGEILVLWKPGFELPALTAQEEDRFTEEYHRLLAEWGKK